MTIQTRHKEMVEAATAKNRRINTFYIFLDKGVRKNTVNVTN
jgi:hypothetical protein